MPYKDPEKARENSRKHAREHYLKVGHTSEYKANSIKSYGTIDDIEKVYLWLKDLEG